jgi:hypothetical protein
MTDFAASMSLDRKERRRRRLQRELRALHAMEGHLRWKELLCAVLAIPALALLSFLVALKLHFFSSSPALAVAGALVSGGAIWWVGRRWFNLALLIVWAMLLVVFESFPDTIDFDMSDPKARRRAKLAQAIARREVMLRELSR